MKTAVVIPSNRSLADEQIDALAGADVIVVEDEGFQRPTRPDVTVLTLDHQRGKMGEDFDLIGHGSAAVRNFGSLYCWKAGYDLVIHMDDDCWPEPGFVQRYVDLFERPQKMLLLRGGGWVSSLHRGNETPWYPRGFPYEARLNHRQRAEVSVVATPAVHMGLWTGTIDLNAVDREAYSEPEISAYLDRRPYLTRDFFPLCAMNFAVKRDYLPVCYQIPWRKFAPTCELQRYDDIIGGLFTLATVMVGGEDASFGPPFVDHRQKDVDRMKQARRENFGNVVIGQLAEILGVAVGIVRRRYNNVSPIDRARYLLHEFERAATETSIRAIADHSVRVYDRWLNLFEESA